MRNFAYWTFTLLVATAAVPQVLQPRPDFTEYSVTTIYRGRPASPVLNKEQRIFRTVIREGAKNEVEFAGHYTVPRFGCGAGCSAFYIVDSINGKVYSGFGVSDLPDKWRKKHSSHEFNRWEFHRDSRLLKINGCPNETNCGFYDYEMADGMGLRLVRKQLLPQK